MAASGGDSPMENNGSASPIGQDFGGSFGGNSSVTREYDSMKDQFDEAMTEISSLKRQYLDSKRRCDSAQERLEYYREQYTAAMNQLETAVQESSSLRANFAKCNSEKIRLEQKVHHLEKKLARIIESMKLENGNSQTICAFLEQYNELKKKYEQNKAECEKLTKDAELYKKKCDELIDEHNGLIGERNELKRQLLMAIQQLDSVQRERDERMQQLKHNDDVIKGLNQVLDSKLKELRRSTEQRNSAEQELSLLLSEKDTVLKENQKLSDDLVIVVKKSTELEARFKEEKQAMLYENERLKGDLEASLHYRDDLVKECETLRQKIDEQTLKGTSAGDHMKRSDFKSTSNESWSKDLTEEKDKMAQDLEAATQEIEILRKSLDKARNEVLKASQDTELAKSRRDWAITEREKIVQERDSVKILCDELRKERDTAISELLAAIRDSENIKKQKDEACREIEQLREHLEAQPVNAPPSRNSARWSCASHDVEPFRKMDTEIVDIDISGLPTDGELGLVLDGGRDEGPSEGAGGVYVVSVLKDSVCDGKLRPNDCITQVNNLDCTSVSRRIVLESIRSSAPKCKVIVKRQLMNASHLYTATLNMKTGRSHGLSLEAGIYIAKIEPGSLAARDNNLAVGDRIISINKKALDSGKSLNDAVHLLEENRNDTLVLVALKQIGQMNSNNRALMYNKMVNICTQTDEQPTRLSDSKGTNKRSSIPVANMDFPFKSAAAAPAAKSTSKITDLIKMTFRGKSQKNSAEAEETLTQENDAILLLDSVLNSENSSKSSVLKRSKRKKESKESKSMGTWPRANVIAHENLSGTIVQNRKKERPALSLFTAALQSKEEKSHAKDRNQEDYFESYPTPTPVTTVSKSSAASNPNRNSNPIPYHVQSPPPNVLNRHSVYRSIEQEPILPVSPGPGGQILGGSGGVNIYARAPKYLDFERHQHPHYHPNRMSLNLTPSDNSLLHNLNEKLRGGNLLHNQQGQNSLDIISLKSQNSIDSFLVPKSPPSLDIPLKPPSRETVDYYALKKMQRNVSKYPSDSENLGPDAMTMMAAGNTSTLPSYSRFQSINAPPSRNQALFPMGPVHPHPHHHHGYRHVSPLTLPPAAHSTDSASILGGGGGGSITEKSEFDSYIPTYHHGHGASIDYQYNKHRFQATRERDEPPSSYSSGYEGGTFPRKKETPRFRIPSNPSVTSKGSGVKNSTGSIEHHGSERGSPMPTFQVEVLSHGSNLNKRNTMTDYCYGQKPSPGDLRRVTIDKSVEPLGITIRCNNNGGGIFVSTVTENSIASQVGLQTGDQLLEVCGLNMRSATYELAASVLRQCGNSMTMLVQYNPDKYDTDATGHSTDEDESISHSGSSTPRNSPSVARTLQLRNQQVAKTSATVQRGIFPPTTSVSSTQSKKSTFVSSATSPTVDTIMKQPSVSSGGNVYQEEPRMLIIETKKKTLGISFVGGNKTGIFVHRVLSESLGDSAGIKVGDQILEFNGTDLRAATAEQAWLEIAKSVDKVSVVVQHNMQKFNQIQSYPDQESIDSLYIKVAFDRTGELGESDLRFVKDDVLYVDNTMFTGSPGLWRAWTLDEYGHRIQCGLIPSQTKVEEELRLHHDTTDADNTSRRSTTSARRSFFRRKKHQRSSSRDSKELASFSNTQLSWFSDSGMLNDETTINSYLRMERLDYPSYRPVLVLGPLAECVVDKLQTDFPKEFERCKLQPMNCSEETLEKNLHNNVYVDYRRRGNIFECTTIQAIKDVRDKKRHCILDICISAVDRLQRVQIYPIVLLLRFRSAKQIKEVKDSRYSTDKISAKAAKEMYEHSLKLETDYGQFISAVIPAGANIHHMSSQVKAAVEDEQKKVLWIPFSTNNASSQ